METKQIFQSTQAPVGPTLVGVMKTGMRDGVATAQILVRTEKDSQIFVLGKGERADAFGLGTITNVDVELYEDEQRRDLVTLSWEPAGPAAPDQRH